MKLSMALQPRPPIVAVMGHIDHGKSSLLDYIRKANVTATEAGGITQHVSAYEAEHEHEGMKRTITFLDTPGHEAFGTLRARGAAVADVAILVIAAEEGVKPQTLEAFASAESSNTPIVVAFTKMDKPGADIERAKVSALENGIYLEGLGGTIAYTGVSSKTGDGVPELLDLVLLTADIAEPVADPDVPGEGFVLESSQDPKQGLSATLMVKNGSVSVGSFVVAGSAFAPVRFIENFAGKRIPAALPSQPARITGWSSLASAGTPFVSVRTKKEAEKLVQAADRLPEQTSATRVNGKEELALILKADVSGSIEALHHELAKLTHERVGITIVAEGIGDVSEADIKNAVASGAHVIGFNVGIDSKARDLADRSEVAIDTYSIIYELGERVASLLKEAAPHITVEKTLGEAKVLKVFSTASGKTTLGAKWVSGSIEVGSQLKLDRRGLDLGRGKVINMQQARADVHEIHTEGEFGLQVEAKAELAAGDTLVCYQLVDEA